MIDINVEASFDQYGRYFFIAKIIETNRKKSKLNILDVGGQAGLARSFLPKDNVTILDILESDMENYIQGSALDMPFKNHHFDVVITADTFEHISKTDRKLFLDECYRVSKDFIVIAAPFETGSTHKAEKEANEIFKSLSNIPYPWLKEHITNGLPTIEDVTNWANKNKLTHISYGNNNLDEWKALISNYFVLENLPSPRGDSAFNKQSREYNETANQQPAIFPAYRYIFGISKNKLKEPVFEKVKQNHDFKSFVPLAKTVSYYLKDNIKTISDYEYIQTAKKLYCYDNGVEALQNSLIHRLANAESELQQIKSSKTFQSFSKLNSNKLYVIYHNTTNELLKLKSFISKKSKYLIYLYPPNLLWRISTKTPAYARNRIKDLAFKNAKEPKVSIIIPIYGKAMMTLDCLIALNKIKHTDYPYEVVLVDDCSPDLSRKIFSKIRGIILHSNDKNLGFVGSCNKGAELAKGEYLIFLNNDTVVDTNWMKYLIDRLRSDSKIGIVGSKLIYPNGLLQEAGGIIYQDGSGCNYGNGDNPDNFKYNYPREVDYCSGASIAITKKLFFDVGKFNTEFSPGYYEDTDLSFTIREKGYKIVYEPLSSLIHKEGGTAGTDLTKSMKKYQVVNKEKFVSKWGSYLRENNYLSPKDNIKARDISSKKMVLIIDHYVPEPDRDSGSVRMFRLIKVLQEIGYKVTFWPQNLMKTTLYAEALEQLGVEVVHGSISFKDFSEQRGEAYDLVILSRASVAPSFIDIVNLFYSNAITIYDTVDLSFCRIEKQAEIENNEELALIASYWKKIELGTMQRVDATLVVSDTEKKLLSEIIPNSTVRIVSNIHISNQTPKPSFGTRSNIIFIGGFSHTPNIDAMIWFCNDIMPLIQKKMPSVKLKIIGSNPPQKILDLANNNIEVLGYVEDVSKIFSKAKIFVSPLRYGAGVKGKIGQAMEYGLPVISTSIGIDGMHLQNGVDCLVANEGIDFANAVIKLYNDRKSWEKISLNSQNVLIKYFSPETAKNNLIQLLEKL